MGNDAGERVVADLDGRNVADRHGFAIPGVDDHGADVLDSREEADRANDQGLVAAVHDAAGRILVAIGERL